MSLPARPVPMVLAAPSGTGKTTIAHALVEGSDAFTFSVSATTRPPREGEEDGVDYLFVSDERFDAMVRAGEMAEWAVVHGHRYGTPTANLEAAAERGEHVVLDIDVQGAKQIRESVPEAVLIFIFPPSAETLAERLAGRGTEAREETRRRLVAGRGELEEARNFDYIVVNEELDTAVDEVREIARAEGRRPERTTDLGAEIRRLQDEIDDIVRRRYAE